jgi:iron complex outermembrane receptor protein
VTLRGNYSEGFLAPTVYNLFGGPQVSFPLVSGADGAAGQAQYVYKSNPNLTPSDSQNIGGGIVISPKAIEGLTVSVDYYKISTENDVFRAGDQYVIDDLNANGAGSQFAPGFTFDDGSTLADLAATGLGNDINAVNISNWGSADVPLFNGAEQETDGFDITLTYEKPTESAGKFLFYASANVLLSYTYSDPFVGGPYEYAGQFTDGGPLAGAQGMLPDFVITTGLTWDYKNLTAAINARYVPEVDDLGTLHESNGNYGWNDFTVDGTAWTIDSYYRIDLQLAYEFGKTKEDKAWYDGTRVAVGVNNITDTQPNLIASSFEDLTDKATYDPLGRFLYFEASKKF